VADRHDLAEAMAALLREENVWTEARAVSARELLHEFRAEECERILERLNSRTTVEVKRDLELRWAAATRLGSQADRRLGLDRRSGLERRRSPAQNRPIEERRAGGDRRSGRDRRSRPAA
jgi:hypothetical protein